MCPNPLILIEVDGMKRTPQLRRRQSLEFAGNVIASAADRGRERRLTSGAPRNVLVYREQAAASTSPGVPAGFISPAFPRRGR
jgi:hypothetical protein